MISSLPRSQLVPILAALLLGTLMTALSTLIVTTALPVVIASLGGLELYSWAFAAALLTSTIAYPIAGRLSDLFGRKALYLVGMTLFMVGSALCGAAQSIEQLIAFRAMQGLGAGSVQPTVSALIADLFAPQQRGKWQGINGAIWGMSSILGPILGGMLAEHVGWRWVFFVNLPTGLLATAIMVRYLPSGLRHQGRVQIDYAGMALLTGALITFLLATLWGGKLFPWTSPQVWGLFVLSLALVGAFVRQEREAPQPIVPLVLFENRSYQTVVALLFLCGVGMFGGTTYIPLYLQAVHGVTPTNSGLLFLPTAVLTVGASIVAGFSMHRIGYRRLTIATMGLSALGFAVVAAMSPESGVMPAVVGVSLVGSAIGLSFPVLLIIAQSSAEHSMVGVATSLVQLSRSLGGTLGVAALGAFLATRLVEHMGNGGPGTQEIAALLRPEALGSLDALAIAELRATLADALRLIFAAGAVMMAAAALIALRLEHVPVVEPRRRATRGQVVFPP